MRKADWIAGTLAMFIDNLPVSEEKALRQQISEMLRQNGIENPELWLLKQVLNQRNP